MKIPNINEQFEGMFCDAAIVLVDDVLKRSGTPIFTVHDLDVSNIELNELDRTLRTIFVKTRVTKEYFAARCRMYAVNVLNQHSTRANSTGSNLLRQLQKGNITIDRFREALVYVLGYKIKNLVIDLESEDGKQENYSLLDSFDL